MGHIEYMMTIVSPDNYRKFVCIFLPKGLYPYQKAGYICAAISGPRGGIGRRATLRG